MSTPISVTPSGPIKNKLICAAVGDSLMWGQGLRLEHRFCYLAAQKLAERAGKIFTPPDIRARSGAQIALASADPQAQRGVRHDFTQTYPELFERVTDAKKFLAGNDRAADELYHDIPATFPLIPTQLEMLGEGPRPDIELLFLNGGANDVDFKQVLVPEGPDLLHIHSALRHRIYYPLRDLLVKARQKCPNALIVVPGYYPMMTTTGTNDDSLIGFIRWFGDAQAKLRPVKMLGWAGAAAGMFAVPAGALVFMHEVSERIEDIANQMRRRAEITFPLSQFWMARAVAEARQMKDVRGPGMVFVNPRFDDVNSIFGSNSFVYGDYNPAKDPLADDRMRRDPRGRFESLLKSLLSSLKVPAAFVSADARKTRQVLLGELPNAFQDIVKLKGPVALVEALSDNEVLESKPKTEELVELLKAELMRLKVLHIASMMHPNAEGAKRYANRIVEDVRTYQYQDSKSNFDSMVTGLGRIIGEPLPTPEETLRAYGLDPDAPRGENMQLIYPDIITIIVHGVRPPKGERGATLHVQNFKSDAVKSVQLTMLRSPNGDSTLLTGDAGGRFFLGAYTRCWVDISVWIEGRHRVEMFVNGRRVLDTEVLTTARGNLQLPYPAPIPGRPAPPPIDPDLVT